MGSVLSQKRGSTNAMEIGMSEAKSWLKEIQVETTEHLGVTYQSPHMWIVALIGSDRFTLTEKALEEKKHAYDVNISIVGLTAEKMLSENV